MRGLIWKDLFAARRMLQFYALTLGGWLLGIVLGILPLDLLSVFLAVVGMMLPLTAFTLDETARWDTFAFCLPMGREQVVRARYLFCLLLLSAGALLSLGAGLLAVALGRGDLAGLGMDVLSSWGLVLLVTDVMLPLHYCLGAERSRPWMLAVLLVPLAVDSVLPSPGMWFYAGVLVLALAGLGLSQAVSCRAVRRRNV